MNPCLSDACRLNPRVHRDHHSIWKVAYNFPANLLNCDFDKSTPHS